MQLRLSRQLVIFPGKSLELSGIPNLIQLIPAATQKGLTIWTIWLFELIELLQYNTEIYTCIPSE